jgi:hypothetical protein
MRPHRPSRSLTLALAAATLWLAPPAAAQGSGGCLAWGDQHDINARLQGPGDVVELCPHAFFELTAPVVFTADGQRLTTQGQPTDDRRAVLRVAGRDQTTAVAMIDRSNVELSHLVIDGNRPQLGYREGEALVFAGGVAQGQRILANRILEPRSWSALQVHEGPPPRCRGAVVEDNEIGPAGMGDGTWADGISFACLDGLVRRNTIVDATDGAIVVFGASGSLIEDNRIVARSRVLLGAIHLVGYAPYDGDFRGTVVRNNLVEADGALIRIGIAMGEPTWVCLDSVAEIARRTLYGATVAGNVLRGAPFQYGYVVDAVRDWTVTGNRSEATHAGTPQNDCRGRLASPPGPFLIERSRASGTFQDEFRDGVVELALWAVPAP